MLIGGAVTGGVSLNIHDDLEGSCNTDICYSEDTARVNRMNNPALTGTVLLAVGGMAAATGLGLLVYHLVRKSRKHESQTSPAITWIPTTNGLMIEGRF